MPDHPLHPVARPVPTVGFAVVCLIALFTATHGLAADLTGEQVYKRHCASCHGASGEGVAAEYPDPLIGTRSLASLTKYIDKRMPEGDPDKVNGKDAAAVSTYIYDAFYSPVAQAKRNAPKIELARLTTGQYRNALADLIGSFRGNSEPGKGGEQGLEGNYANGKNVRGDRAQLRRVDATIDFDFGEKSPDEKVAKEEFAIRWTGGVFIAQPGEYEFIVRTKNGTRLWVNDERTPLIDAWVRSGDNTEYRATRQLLGGRTYPLRLETFKEKKEKAAAITLRWKPPQKVEAVLPASVLRPGKYQAVYVSATPFPPDDRSMGYERGTFISKAWDESTTDAALETAEHILANLPTLAGTEVRGPNAAKALPDFCGRLAERAFRRPLSPEDRRFYVDRHFEKADDLELALKKAVLLTLKSPRFLYHDPRKPDPSHNDAHGVASRIAFALWDSLPDKELLDAARTGKLASRDDVIAQVKRMLPDPRTKAKLLGFLQLWLNLDRMHELAKDHKEFPQFDEQVVSDLRTSMELFLDEVLSSDAADYRQLISADHVYLNGRLAALYGGAGADLPSDAPFQKVSLKQRAGVLTHPLLMAGFAYEKATSPIHRGVFVSRNLLGRRLKPPPEAITPLAPELHPDSTTRERTILQTSAKSCMSCHAMINPLGFTFENFDAVGRFREAEKEKPIDSTGSYETAAGDVVKFKSAPELAAFLIGSEEAQIAFVERLFHHAVKQPILAHGYDQPEKLRSYFVGQNYNIKSLLVEIVAAAATAKPD